MTFSPLVSGVLSGGYRRLSRKKKIKLFKSHYMHNKVRKKKKDGPPLSSPVPTTATENSSSPESRLHTGTCLLLRWLTGRPFQLCTFCSFCLRPCSDVGLIAPPHSFHVPGLGASGSCCKGLLWGSFITYYYPYLL